MLHIAHGLQHCQAIHFGKHQIHHQNIWFQCCRQLYRAGPVPRNAYNLKPLGRMDNCFEVLTEFFIAICRAVWSLVSPSLFSSPVWFAILRKHSFLSRLDVNNLP